MKKLLSVLLLTGVLSHIISCSLKRDPAPTIILISLDGFHPDYLQRNRDLYLNTLADEGVRAKWMIPVFPTKTFPAHYSIVTGLYSEHHGIVHNTIYDTSFKATFSLGKREEVQNTRWWQGEPIWVTAEKNGIKTAPFFFPGSEAEIYEVRPAFWKPYDGTMTNRARIDTVLSWLALPAEDRPQFITLYFSDLDDAGHDYAPLSREVDSTVQYIDGLIKQLADSLRYRDIFDDINLIVVSDHGMARVDPGQIIILDDYFLSEDIDVIIWDNQLTGIFPKSGREEIVYNKLIENNPAHLRIFRRQNLPESFHYSGHSRIPPIICLADEGWIIMNRSTFERKQKEGTLPQNTRGAHGYDNQLESMRAIFLARGPAFKKGLLVEPFENIQLYHLMAQILKITPAANDGTADFSHAVLK